MKKAFQRRCMACYSTEDKYNLIRIVRTAEGKIVLDTQNVCGEGKNIYKL